MIRYQNTTIKKLKNNIKQCIDLLKHLVLKIIFKYLVLLNLIRTSIGKEKFQPYPLARGLTQRRQRVPYCCQCGSRPVDLTQNESPSSNDMVT